MSSHAPNPGELHDEQIVELLRSGAHSTLLSAYFGDVLYRQLCQHAKLAATSANPDGPIVYVLPGIMGSKLGSARHDTHLVWLHPTSISNGGMLKLALPDTGELHAAGVLLPGYLKLKLMLEIAGFRPVLYAFDWRRDLLELGRSLVEHMDAYGHRSVMLVAHSMGGLVARAALALDTRARISKLIQMGAPNEGSFAPVQALRAVYPTVRKIAALDQRHTAEELARKVFLSLPGLYQLLPSPHARSKIDLFDARCWPQDELAPSPQLLADARASRAKLAAADERCFVIAGTSQETITDIDLVDGQFEYTITRNGDGTVPLCRAHWPGARTWYAEENHGALTNNDTVLAATVELLQNGTTVRLAARAPTIDGHRARITNDRELRRQALRKLEWDTLSLDTRRRILEPVISPEFLESPASSDD